MRRSIEANGGRVVVRKVKPVPAAEWKAHLDQRRGFCLEHPSDWNVHPGLSGLLVSLVGPDKTGGFLPNLNLVRRVNDTSSGLDRLAKVAAGEVLRLLTDVTILDAEATVVSGSPARWFLFSYRQGIYGLTGERWIFLTPVHLWTVTAGTATEEYDSIAGTLTGVVRSLRVDDHVR